MDFNAIKPYSKNPKKHPDVQLKAIANSIKEFGWRQPIVVWKDWTIIVWHWRYFAYQKYKDEMSLPEPRIEEAKDLDDKKITAYRIADNKLNESDWDMEILKEEFQKIDPLLIDMTWFDNSFINIKKEEMEVLNNIKENEFLEYTQDVKDFNKKNEDVILEKQGIKWEYKERFPVIFWFDDEEEYNLVKTFFQKGNWFDKEKLIEIMWLTKN